jgi:hypothetical protein
MQWFQGCFILRFTLHYVNLFDLLVDFISFLPSSCYDDISVIIDNHYGSLRFGKYLDELGIPFVFTMRKNRAGDLFEYE